MWRSFAVEIILSQKRKNQNIDSVYSSQFFSKLWSVSKIMEWNFLECPSLFFFDVCWFHHFPNIAQPIPSPASGAQREQKQTDLPWDLIQVSTAAHNAFATSFKSHISILAHADKRSETSLVSGATTEQASITTKHYHHNKIKHLIIFQVIDSEVMKSSVHFGISAFQKILLIFLLTSVLTANGVSFIQKGEDGKRTPTLVKSLSYLYLRFR